MAHSSDESSEREQNELHPLVRQALEERERLLAEREALLKERARLLRRHKAGAKRSSSTAP
jgi:hypothetical protein